VCVILSRDMPARRSLYLVLLVSLPLGSGCPAPAAAPPVMPSSSSPEVVAVIDAAQLTADPMIGAGALSAEGDVIYSNGGRV